MPIAQEHELHKRRLSRNLGLGLTLIAFVVLVFGMTIVKVQHQDEAKKAAQSSVTTSLTAGAKK